MKVLLLSADYVNKKIRLKFYEPNTNRLILLTDKSNYLAHCYVSNEDGVKINELPGINNLEQVDVFNVIKDEMVSMTNVEVNNPLVIGGIQDSLRENFKCWEADIKHYQNYLYDKGLIVGSWYNIDEDSNITPIVSDGKTFDLTNIDMDSVVDQSSFSNQLTKWAELLSQEIPHIKRMAFDIEVESGKGGVPDVYKAKLSL